MASIATFASAALAALVLSLPASPATLAERSPFVQGHWWNPSRSGSGFDVFNTSEQVAVVWYTYDENSRPTWYVAQGSLATLGTQTWPLLQQKWAGGHPTGLTPAGTLRLEILNPESLSVTWSIGGHSGQWNIEPLVASGIQSETDHSGHWYNPDNSGWGFNLTEQGDVLGSVLYAYDAAGLPTWVAGFGRDAAKNSVDMFSYNGACPWCAYRSTLPTKVGTVTFEYRAEADLVIHSPLSIALASGVNVDGARAKQLGRAASLRPADRQLAQFDTSAALKAYLDAGMLNIPAPSGVDFSPAPAGSAAFSTTNLQEQGVDEADFLKSDGRFAYAYRHDASGTREPVIRVAEIGTDGSFLAIRGTVALASGSTTPLAQAGLYLAGSQLVSITGTRPVTSFGAAWATSTAWTKGKTNVEVLDVSNPAAPATRWRAEIDGHLVASRRIADKLYVVTRSVPFITGFVYGAPPMIFSGGNRDILAATALESMLPAVRIDGGSPAPLVLASSLFAPPQGSSPPVADIVVVTAIDLVRAVITQSLGVAGPVEAIYASPRNLYLATRRGLLRGVGGSIATGVSPSLVTDIHRIGLDEDAMRLVGSASVEGFLASNLDMAPFRMSESQNRLRVVTSTTSQMGWGIRGQANTLTILEPSSASPGMLRTVSMLPNAARTETLGNIFEELYATRYVGDRLYAVTFPTAHLPPADPLYSVDLSNASDPRIMGNLVIPGFSDYLHPLANGMLLGFGRTVTTQGVQQGLQLSLFDVAADGAPQVVQQIAIGKRGSDSALLYDHHAISVLERPDGNVNVAFPARVHDGAIAFGSGDTAMYTWRESGLMRYEARLAGAQRGLTAFLPILTEQQPQTAPPIDPATSNARSVQLMLGTLYVANGRFWLQSNAGVTTGPL